MRYINSLLLTYLLTLAIPHLILVFFLVFNPWDLYYQGYKKRKS